MKLYLIRHGKSIYNEKKIFTGQIDIALSVEGNDELSKINLNLPELTIYSSPLKRCVETSEILFNRVDILDSRLKETYFGDLEGCVYKDLYSNEKYIKWSVNKDDNILNGETYNQFKERVCSFINECDNDSIVVTHGGVIRLIMHELFDQTIPFHLWDIPNGLGYIIDLENHTYSSLK
jgi:broad specificity phosphatase PhoE